jgi:hypothetical protein
VRWRRVIRPIAERRRPAERRPSPSRQRTTTIEKGLRTVSKPPTETTAEAALHHTAAPSLAHRRELAHRLSGVVEVTLYWSADDDSTGVGRSRNPHPNKRCSSESHASVRSTPSTTPSAT